METRLWRNLCDRSHITARDSGIQYQANNRADATQSMAMEVGQPLFLSWKMNWLGNFWAKDFKSKKTPAFTKEVEQPESAASV